MNVIKNDLKFKLENNSNNYETNLKLGLTFVNEKNYSEAEKIFKKLTITNKNRFEGFLNLSNVYEIQNKKDKSERILKKYINDKKYHKEIISGLAIIYFNSEQNKKLKILINQYVSIEENHILFFLKAYLFELENKFDDQIIYLKKSINNKKEFWPAYEKLFNIFERTNKIDEFENLINISKKIFKDNIILEYYLGLCLFRQDKNIEAISYIELNNTEEKLKKIEDSRYLINFYDLLSKINLKLNKFNLCLKFALKRNTLSIEDKNNKNFNKNTLLDIIEKYKIYFTKFNHKSVSDKNVGTAHKNLVFLVGFPRSGTTLLDTILRSHSKTKVLEEKPYLINIRHKFFRENTLDKISNISENQIYKLQKEYFNSFNYSKEKITIDKFPLNLIELGFIKKIFPDSKIILALRHPFDTILSCVLTSFKMNEAMANYENLETTAYFYNEVFNLFNAYKKSLNLQYHTIKYENVVNNFDFTIKNLVSFLNLEYESALNNYYSTAKKRAKINTPSYYQVVEPIYNRSINRYKNFPEINKIESLISKWIKEFDYNL